MEVQIINLVSNKQIIKIKIIEVVDIMDKAITKIIIKDRINKPDIINRITTTKIIVTNMDAKDIKTINLFSRQNKVNIIQTNLIKIIKINTVNLITIISTTSNKITNLIQVNIPIINIKMSQIKLRIINNKTSNPIQSNRRPTITIIFIIINLNLIIVIHSNQMEKIKLENRKIHLKRRFKMKKNLITLQM